MARLNLHKNITGCFFICFRVGQLLDVAQERTPESLVYGAIQDTLADCSQLSLTDYTSTESFNIEAITGIHHFTP